MVNESVKKIMEIHSRIKGDIVKRLEFFRSIWERGDERELFGELCFCLLTPQSKARMAERAMNGLLSSGVLWNGDAAAISSFLNVVRFKNKKGEYIVDARNKIFESGVSLKKLISDRSDIIGARNYLAVNVKGFGYKEASHFLRNIGRGDSVAILDRHILKNLKNCGVIDAVPESMTPSKYFDIESRLLTFAGEVGIPPDHLDFVMWYNEAGEIFK